MPKIGNPRSFSDSPCDRCGSRRKVSKNWTEKIRHDHDDGFMTLYHSQIICTNIVCQSAFEKNLSEETAKREKLRLERAANTFKRTNIKISA